MNEHAWSSWEEWRVVRALLYSPDPSVRRHGCHRVSAWMVRGMNTPLPVRCTSDLVEAQLLDHSVGILDSSNMATSNQVRLAYAMALVRLVNNAADDGQRGEYAQSVASLAQRIGLPKWLVDVRHESTHQKLPTVEVLRLAATQALNWLDEHYWIRQNLEIEHIRNLDARFDEIREAVDAGRIKRSIGPSLPSASRGVKRPRVQESADVKIEPKLTSGRADNDEEEDQDRSMSDEEQEGPTGNDAEDAALSVNTSTAQDLVHNIRRNDYYDLAKAFFRCLSRCPAEHWQPPLLIHWERILHWLDGEMELRVSRKLVMVCMKEHLEGKTLGLTLLVHLLSRRFHMENRATLSKIGQKSLLIESFDSWTEKERLHMSKFAMDVFLPELSAGLRLCLAQLEKVQAFELIDKCILPVLMMKKSPEESTQLMNTIRMLAKLKRGLTRTLDDEELYLHNVENISIEDLKALASVPEEEEGNEDMSQQHKAQPLNQLKTDGEQEWTKVIWPGGPIGACLDNPRLCPALVIAPPPPAPSSLAHSQVSSSKVSNQSSEEDEGAIDHTPYEHPTIVLDNAEEDDHKAVDVSENIVVSAIANKVRIFSTA